MIELTIGDPAPKFAAPDQDGNMVSLDQFKGKKLVLYFYPKDNTPGCTAEACDLRDNYEKFLSLGYDILGVSADSQKSHQNFISKYDLPFRLLSDVDKKMLESYNANKKSASRDDKDAVTFVKQKLDSAKWFIDAIRQRQNTLMLTMEAILQYQAKYFEEGDETLFRPMILKDIADMTGLDISTISRVVNSKYIQTHFGIFPLKYFFSEGMQTDSGEEVSTREIKKILNDCISNEDKRKPLTDDKLAVILQEKGYQIARRTVAKYREQLNLPVARLRKEL